MVRGMTTRTLTLPLALGRPLPGMLLASGIGCAAMAAATALPSGLAMFSPLTLAMVLGLAAGNLMPGLAGAAAPGIGFCRGRLLRLGIVLFGLNLTFTSFAAVGWQGLALALAMLLGTFTLAVTLGPRLFGLDRETSLLIGIGSAICGAAAIVAAEPIVRSGARQTSLAILCVVLFGTTATLIYPMLYPHLGLSETGFGLYAGSTIHEVAQVVAAARAVSEQAANVAVVEKMLRVLMLAPFLMALSWRCPAPSGAAGRITIPWFALGFVAMSLVNTLGLLPEGVRMALLQVDGLLLATAMAALGLQTRLSAVREAGMRPLLLGGALTLFLAFAGYGAARLLA